MWPGEDPIGRELQLVRGIGPGRTVIGVVEDITAHAVQEGPVPYVYVPALQEPQIQALSNASLIARDGAGGSIALASIRTAIAREDPTLPIFRERLVSHQISGVLVPQRLGSTLLGIFGFVALLVGARPADVVLDVTRQTLTAVMIGALAGTAAALWLTRLVEAYLFGIPRTDPIAYLGAAALLGLTALLATLGPARHAIRVSPLSAIRTEM